MKKYSKAFLASFLIFGLGTGIFIDAVNFETLTEDFNKLEKKCKKYESENIYKKKFSTQFDGQRKDENGKTEYYQNFSMMKKITVQAGLDMIKLSLQEKHDNAKEILKELNYSITAVIENIKNKKTKS